MIVWENLVQTISADTDERELPRGTNSSYIVDSRAEVKELPLLLALNKLLNNWVVRREPSDELVDSSPSLWNPLK
jgi:hypothetical protein